MHGSAEPNNIFSTGNEPALPRGEPQATPPMTNQPPASESRALPANDLDAALQLLVERARYITGATGAALALLQDDEMVCRASAGYCAPSVGARLQVRSGLTGESIARKQLLRCDNAENDPRVNLDTCRALGIASIVVLPLLARTGQVLGLFELFSDHAYAFEERDLIALERMAELTRTALDLSEKREVSVVAAPRAEETQPAPASAPEVASSDAKTSADTAATTKPAPASDQASVPPLAAETASAVESPAVPGIATPEVDAPQSPVAAPPLDAALPPIAPAMSSASAEIPSEPATPPAIPEAMLRVQKCSSCGFPISEGRTLCVDCENKRHLRAEQPSEAVPVEFVPAFLSSQKPPSESWLANHVNVLAVLVLILSIVVAVVVFR